MISLFIFIYLLGALLAYGRGYAALEDRSVAAVIAATSWAGVCVGTMAWTLGHKAPFLRYRKQTEVMRIATIVTAKLKQPIYDFDNGKDRSYLWMEKV